MTSRMLALLVNSITSLSDAYAFAGRGGRPYSSARM